MKDSTSTQLYQQVSRLRWLVLAFGLILVVIHQILEGYVQRNGVLRWELIELIYGVIAAFLAWGALTWVKYSLGKAQVAEHAQQQTHIELTQANQRLEFLLHVNRRLSVADNEEILIETILELVAEVTPAVACSLIRFNERQQVLSITHHNGSESDVIKTDVMRLETANIYPTCHACKHQWSVNDEHCLMFMRQLSISAEKTHCVKLKRGDHIYGFLRFHLTDSNRPDDQEKILLEMMANEMTLALESQVLRSRELTMLNRLQGARNLSSLYDDLEEALAASVEALEATGGVLFLTGEEETAVLQTQIEVGQSLNTSLELVKGLAGGVERAETSLIISDLEQNNPLEPRSLLVAPLRVENRILGSFVLWSINPDNFTRHHAQLVATVAGQAALLVENNHLYLRGKYQATLAERARLAREIHDGLAQTLGYLKLRATQISGWLQTHDIEQATDGLDQMRHLLNDVYVDMRESIDGLRLNAAAGDVNAWVHEISSEFESLSNIPVEITPFPETDLPLEMHAQLQRIVQETFSNIRKHADATRVWLRWQKDDYWLTLRISDNGHGFDPDDIPPIARHGLCIMRERADLLDADFQISSQPDDGTQITVRLPLKKLIDEAQNV